MNHRKLQRWLWKVVFLCVGLFSLAIIDPRLAPAIKHPAFLVGVAVAWFMFLNEAFLEEDE